MEGPLLTESEHIIDITNDGSSSSINDQQQLRDPYTNESIWNSIEFVVTLVLIILKNIHKHYCLYGSSGYTCGCIATLPILCWRFWLYNRSVGPESIEEHLREKRINKDLDFFMMCFFVGWFVVFLWILSSIAFNSSALDDTTTQFFWLCLALLTFSCIRYVIFNLTLAMVCYTCPMLFQRYCIIHCTMHLKSN
ncbi:hypothetical protein ARALYDRAFT_312551 [Arabidopsis lyrata subsp. lyrata]|uniref:Uncharacterized protein n=1 Tax=Arabidopsis lyrata subsp. lyrata TaxID=81972 RepID=D7KDH5_ARALL|nr:hypothetical protein ARALYDRAFT_312551 [Arabidopsis lyrata subsp. lyrata]